MKLLPLVSVLVSVFALSVCAATPADDSFAHFVESIGHNGAEHHPKPLSEDILDHESKVFNAGYSDLYSFLHIDEIQKKPLAAHNTVAPIKKMLKPNNMVNHITPPQLVSFKQKNTEDERLNREIEFIKRSLK